MSMSRGRNAEKEKNRGLAPITRASDKLRCFFGKVQWKRKVATVLIAAMMTGTMADSLNAVGLGRYANAYASSSDAVRAEEDDSGGRQSYSGKAENYFLEDAQEDLDLQLNGADLKDAMESEEPLELDYQYFPYEDNAEVIAAYEEITKQAKGYRLLDQDFLQAEDEKVSYLVYGKKDKKSSNWIDDLKVFVLNGSEEEDYNVYFTIDSDELKLTSGKVGIKVFKKSTAPSEKAGGQVSPVGGQTESTAVQPSESSSEPTEEIKIVTDQESSQGQQEDTQEAVETSSEEVEEPESSAPVETESPQETSPEETKKPEETSSEEAEEPESSAPVETERSEETSPRETEEAETSAPEETEKPKAAEEPLDVSAAGTAGKVLTISRHIADMVATASDAEKEDAGKEDQKENTGANTEAQIAALREEATMKLRLTSQGKGYTFSKKELQMINMEEEEEEDDNIGRRFFARMMRGMAPKAEESHNVVVCYSESIAEVRASTETVNGFIDEANKFYGGRDKKGNNKSEPQIVEVTPRIKISGEKVKAGELYDLVFRVTPTIPETYDPKESATHYFYEELSNINVYFKLPTGWKLKGQKPIETGDYKDYYQLNVGNMNLSSYIDKTCQVYVDGNEVLEDGYPFTFLSENDIYVTSKITAVDPYNENIRPEYTICEQVEGLEKELISEVPDEWDIRFTYPNPNENNWRPTKDADGNDVIELTYVFETGLLDGERFLKQPEDYRRIGRGAFDDDEFEITGTVTVEGLEGVLPTAVQYCIGDSKDMKPATLSGNTFTINEYSKQGFSDAGGQVSVGNDAPIYTEYKVTVQYPYEKFQMNYKDFQEAGENDLRYQVNTDVSLTYQIKGKNKETTDHKSVKTTKIRQEIEPAVIKIYKEILDNRFEDASAVPYTTIQDKAGKYPGLAEFEIYCWDGEDSPGEDDKDSENWKDYKNYRVINVGLNQEFGGRIVVNPVKDTTTEAGVYATGDKGYVEIQVEPGHDYKITEKEVPKYTQKSDDKIITKEDLEDQDEKKRERTFINSVTGQGRIKFQKFVKDQSGDTAKSTTPLNEINFALFATEDAESPIAGMTAKSQEEGTQNGIVTFKSVPAGTYFLREYGNENGTYRESKTPRKVFVQDGKTTDLGSLYNELNSATFTLNKKLKNDNEAVTDVPKDLKDDFDKRFTLEWKKDGKWVSCSDPQSLTSDSQAIWTNLHRYNNHSKNGEPYEYRLVETVPDGYTVLEEQTTLGKYGAEAVKYTHTSEEEEEEGKAYIYFNFATDESEKYGDVVATSVSSRNANLTVTKKVLSFKENGDQAIGENPDSGRTIGLFKKASDSSYVLVKDASTGMAATGVTNDDGTVTFSGYPVFEGSNRILYYVGEKVEPNAILYGTTTVVDVGNDQYKVLTGKNDEIKLSSLEDQTKELLNVSQVKVPYWIKKEDSKGGFAKSESGTQYATITVTSADNSEPPQNVVVNDAEGVKILLTPGKTYMIQEKEEPSGYVKNEDVITRVVGKFEITKEWMEEVSNTRRTPNAADGVKDLEIVITNQKKPVAKIIKTSGDALLTKNFEVFIKNGDSFDQVGTTQGQEFTLDAGTYYFKEVVDDENYINPYDDKALGSHYQVAGDYQNTPAYKEAHPGYEKKESERAVYFGPFKLENNFDGAIFTLENVSNKGNIKAQKLTPSDNQKHVRPLRGAEFTLSWTENGEPQSRSPIHSSLIEGGNITINDLKIFDSQGNKIKYTLTETKVPDGYIGSDPIGNIELEEGVDTAIDAGTFINIPKV